jgi:hypothetical protein
MSDPSAGSRDLLRELPARLHVVLAREAPRAVIVRRGPSRWVRIILWHTDTDQFEGGQWLRGRIYGERCALSPDGALFLYFAMQQHKSRGGYLGTWTAISKPPYLTALALWPVGDTWGGGGLFIDDQTIYISGHTDAHPDHQPPKHLRVITTAAKLTKRDHRFLDRIKARDWQQIYKPDRSKVGFGWRWKDPAIWQRAHPFYDRYFLAMRWYGYITEHYPGPMIQEYALGDRTENKEIALEGANWADWDQRGRLVYARDGQVFAQEPDQVGTFARPLADFNDQKFEAIAAPDWAQRW